MVFPLRRVFRLRRECHHHEDTTVNQPYRVDLLEQEAGRARLHRVVRTTLLLVGGIAAVMVCLFAWRVFVVDMPNLPNREALWALNRPTGYTFLDANNKVIATRGPRHGRRVTLGDMPRYVSGAFLATEDRRFYEHGGVDLKSIARAMVVNAKAGRTVQGASTLTQQLVKNLLLTPERTLRRKLQEVILAARIERLMSKDEILELYLNRVYLGEGTYGVEAAARVYFGKSPNDLSVAEAAMLGALPKAPSRYDPTENIADARKRARKVLKDMLDTGVIAPEDYVGALRNPATPVKNQGEGELGYVLDMAVARTKELVPNGAPDLIIRLTIDPAIQNMTQKALSTRMATAGKAQKATQAAMVVMAPDGAVRALVGGLSYTKSPFNRAFQAKRQPGSTFKAFVFAAGLEQGLLPDDVRTDSPITIGNWSPQNYDGSYYGPITLKRAFAKSLNTVSVRLAQEIGPLKIVDVARRFGMRTRMEPNLSIALGTSEVTLYEITAAFAVFQNDGRAVTPHFIHSIETAGGETLYREPKPQNRVVYDPLYARRMVEMLRAVITGGTGMAAALPNQPVAGKTGTSQGHRDAWFIGFTPQYTAGVWVGNDDFTPMRNVVGGMLPSEIWRDVMSPLHEGLAEQSFSAPELSSQERAAEAILSFYRGLAADLISGDAPEDDADADNDAEAADDPDALGISPAPPPTQTAIAPL